MAQAKLVRVCRSTSFEVPFNESRTHHPRGINPRNIGRNESFHDDGEFFEVNEADLPRIVAALARGNPGKDVHIYELTSVSVCPAGDLVVKKVTKDGVLPV